MNNAFKVTTNNNASPLTNAIDRGNELQSEFIKSLSKDQRNMLSKLHFNVKDVKEFLSFQDSGYDELSPALEAECELAKQVLNFTDLAEIIALEENGFA